MSPIAKVFVARRVLAARDDTIEDGGVLVVGGEVVRVLRSAAAVKRALRADARRVDVDGATLAPGFVNAHAHLELSGLRGRVPGDHGFVDWIRVLMRERASRDLLADTLNGARRALETGTTTVGDIDSSGAMARVGARTGLRVRVYREVLDAWEPERTRAALSTVRRKLPARRAVLEGLSPHAPFSTSSALLEGAVAIARRRAIPLACHWSETEAECDWLLDGRGELAALLGHASPRRTGLDLLEAAGVLDVPLTLIHGNHPRRGEPARLARAGVVLVHCPGTHRFFGREPFPWRTYERAGVPLALGTDSLASNDDLDMGREMALFRRAAPDVSPARVWEMATAGAARALRLQGRVGELRPGAAADMIAVTGESTAGALLERLTSGKAKIRAVWVGGRVRAAFEG